MMIEIKQVLDGRSNRFVYMWHILKKVGVKLFS